MKITLSTNKNGYYSLRFRVHKILTPYFKKRAINKSLYTKNKKLAKLKATKLYYHYQQILQTISIISTEETQELTDTFISKYLKQTIMTTFTINETKYKAVNTISVQLAYDKFCVWYKQQNITDKQYAITTSKLSTFILPFLGVNTDIEDITLETIEEYKEFLTTFPNINKKQYRNLSYQEIIELENIPKRDTIGISTQVKYLSIIKQFFSYLLKANILTYNPCTLLNMPNGTVQNREPFDKEDMQKFSKIFLTLDNRKYIYWTLAYTGMRPSEFWKCKISTSKEGVIYFDLTDTSLQLKTKASHRAIPLHNKLLEMNIHNLLPLLQAEFTQAGVSSYFNKTLKYLVTDNQNKILYSYRHMVATELKRADIGGGHSLNMDMVSEILGHTYENTTMTKEVYAKGFKLEQLRTAINYLNFE